MSSDLANDVKPIFEPRKLGASRDGENPDLAVLALVTRPRYVFAIVSETRFSVV